MSILVALILTAFPSTHTKNHTIPAPDTANKKFEAVHAAALHKVKHKHHTVSK